MLTNHWWSLVAFTKSNFTENEQNTYPWDVFVKYKFNITTASPRGQWVNSLILKSKLCVILLIKICVKLIFYSAFCLLTLNALHLSTKCVLIKVSYVEIVFLKGVNQDNIESVASSMHVTNSDKKPLSQLLPNNHLNQCRLIINQVVSTVLPRISFLILYQISEKCVCKCELVL